MNGFGVVSPQNKKFNNFMTPQKTLGLKLMDYPLLKAIDEEQKLPLKIL
jgi:hypothetical protein